MKHTLRQWWTQPVDFGWVVAYHQINPVLRYVRLAIGVWVWLFGVICLLALLSAREDANSVQLWLFALLAMSTVIVGAAWVFGSWPTESTSRLFVLYAEAGIALALIAFMSPLTALSCGSIFGVIGAYIASCHGPRAFVAHQVWAGAVCLFLYSHALQHDGDPVLAGLYLILLLLVLFSAPVLTHVLLLRLRQDAAAAFFDPLTGLSNRRGLDAAVQGLYTAEQPPIAMVLDLDNFKSVNDQYGHPHGDMVLRRAATAIYSAFPPPAITARTGGEEFAVMVCSPIALATARAEQLRLEFADQVENSEGYATVSIGIAHAGDGVATVGVDELLGRADLAMYTAKRRGGNTVVDANAASSTG